MVSLSLRFIWLAWGGVMALEGAGWWFQTPSQTTMIALRLAELLWLAGLVIGCQQARALGLEAPTRNQWLLAGKVAIGCALLAAVAGVMGWLLPWVALPPFIHGIGGLLLLLVLAPLVEELLFRGLLYRMLDELVGAWAAIAGSAICFALAHGVLLSPQLLGGLLFAWVYVRSGNLWLPILLHAGGNGALLLLHGMR